MKLLSTFVISAILAQPTKDPEEPTMAPAELAPEDTTLEMLTIPEPEAKTVTTPTTKPTTPKPEYEDEPEAETDDSIEPAEEGKTSDDGQNTEESDDTDSGEFETQTVKTTLTVGEKAHNMCELAEVDQSVYRCDETEDEFLRCTATCPNGSGIIKQNCECYKYFGPLVLYDPDNCIWNAFDGECFDEEPIPEGGFPDSSNSTDCPTCGLEAEKIADEPTNVQDDEETDNPKFMRPVKVVSNNQEDGDSWFAAEDLDDQAHFSGFLRHLDRWAKLTLVAVEQGEMQPVIYQQL